MSQTNLNDAGATSNAPLSGESASRSSRREEDANNTSNEEEAEMSLEELLYSASSYHAIAKPVTLTMILSALAVIFINTPATIEQGTEQLGSFYTVFSTVDSQAEGDNATTLGLSLANAFIIVCVIGCMTFVIVLLYKYRCMKFLIGYMVVSSTTLLGLLGGVMFDVAIQKYRLTIDVISFYGTMANFALVGAVAIFFQKGIPMYITQGYLICTSVILSWQLSHFETWTTWTLLVMLALYDLCAVLTPCGPLKALVNLMQEDDSPEMPGLLYEAELPAAARRPGRGRSRRPPSQQTTTSSNQSTPQEPAAASLTNHSENTTSGAARASSAFSDEDMGSASNAPRQKKSSKGEKSKTKESGTLSTRVIRSEPSSNTTSLVEDHEGMEVAIQDEAPPPPYTTMIPFAIARLYRLPVLHPLEANRDTSYNSLLETPESENQATSPNTSRVRSYTPEQLTELVEVTFPTNGGRIESQGSRYLIIDRHGVLKRTLNVDESGRVYEERRRVQTDGERESFGKRNSIKLGLGDFIFYSLLVSKAAMYSFTTFAACMLVILAGLGGTLVLLSVYHQALPALPISIFLGVTFYLLTREVIEPYIEDLLHMPFYV